jgi:hypothetical protein
MSLRATSTPDGFFRSSVMLRLPAFSASKSCEPSRPCGLVEAYIVRRNSGRDFDSTLITVAPCSAK